MLIKPFPVITRLGQLAMLFPLIFLSACTELVQDEFEPYGPYPAITGFLHSDSIISVRVSLMKELGSEPLPVVSDAFVLLLANETIIDTLDFADGRYYSSHTAQENTRYRVKVKIPGLDTASAACHVPTKPVVNHIEHINIACIGYNYDEPYPYPGVDISFRVEPHKTSYYEVLLRDANNDYWFPINTLTDPALLAEGYGEYYYNHFIAFSSRYISAADYVVRINYEEWGGVNGYYKRDPLVVYFRAVSEEYYLFQKSLYAYEQSLYEGFNLSGYDMQNLYSNVNGGIGIFAGASTVLSDTIYPEPVSEWQK
jgi:hypothetical protein